MTPRLLYLQTSPVPPTADATADRFALLSDNLRGEVLQPLWFTEAAQVTRALGKHSWPRFRRRNFTYRWILAWKKKGAARRLSIFWFYITEGLRAHQEEPLDCVMAYSHMTTAVCGVILKWLTGARLVVEVISSPDRVFIKASRNPGLAAKLRKVYSDFCLHFTLLNCDCVHLLYPTQLDAYPLLRGVRRAVFHEYVRVGAVPKHAPQARPYIMLAGAPWYMKGADLLVEAFLRVAPDFPGIDLKILGHNPWRGELDRLIAGSPRIAVLDAVPQATAIRMISEAEIFCLASRNEGMGRVILEAMAAGVPVIGSRVGGIPTLIRHDENGFLFPEEDVDALEVCLRRLLSDADLRAKMGARGREMALTEFSETVYIDRFTQMIHAALNRDRAEQPGRRP